MILCTECLLCSRKTRGKDLVRLAGHGPSSIETSITRAASLSRVQRFLLVFQSRKVGPGFRFLPAGYRGSSWIGYGLAAYLLHRRRESRSCKLSINLEPILAAISILSNIFLHSGQPVDSIVQRPKFWPAGYGTSIELGLFKC